MSQQPNIVLILTDDHANGAISAYGSQINKTPNIDSVANLGARFDTALVTNALCTPSRATILTGTYSHVNGVTTLATPIDSSQPQFPAALQAAGYRTGFFGKWHMGHGPGHDPQGFDHWETLDDQGTYWDPVLLTAEGPVETTGYATDILTDRALAWVDEQPADQPWCLLLWHKAPHRPWAPHPRHADLYTDPIPVPESFWDDYSGRATPAHHATMRVADDLSDVDLKEDPPSGLDYQGMAEWKYQRYLADYLRCVAAVDESVGAVLDKLKERGEFDRTLTMYGSDQGFFLGEHGWFDKRFMYEESLRMPLVMAWPDRIAEGQARSQMVSNLDIAQTILDAADCEAPARMQGQSMLPLVTDVDEPPARDAFYYRFYEHDDHMHHVWAHYGVRTDRYKLIYYYADGLGLPNTGDVTYPPEWELFDLVTDPQELQSVYHEPAYRSVRDALETRLAELQAELGDEPYIRPTPAERAAARPRT